MLGEHGSTQVLLFSTAKINGQPVDVSEDIQKTIYSEIPMILKTLEELQAGRTAGWTCAVGLAEYVRAIQANNGTVVPCSVVLKGEYGVSDISMSVPAVLGAKGVEKVQELPLSEDEQRRLKITVDTLTPNMRKVEELLA